MVNRKCRMLFRSLCISMSVMLAAAPASPCFQAAEAQTEVQTQEAAAADNSTSSQTDTVAADEAKNESVPASSEDKASDSENSTGEVQPQSDAPSGTEAGQTGAPDLSKALESPQSEAPAKQESESASNEAGKESGISEQTPPAQQAQPESQDSPQTEAADSGKDIPETEQAKQENTDSIKKESGEKSEETNPDTVQSMDADSSDDQAQDAEEHTVTIEGGESTDGTSVYHTGDTVHIRANVPEGQEFVQWIAASDTVRFLDNSNTKVEASFTMPDEDVTVRAQFKATHSVTVQNGYARVNSESTARAKEGDKVTVVADSVRGKKFKAWSVNGGNISLSSTTEKEAVFTMPDEDVSVSATYEDVTVGKPELALNGSAQNYLVGDDIDITLSSLTVSGCEKTVWTINFPSFVYFHRFVNGVSLASGDADIRVEVKEKGSTSWVQISDIPNYEGHATDVRIIASSRNGDNDLEIAMRNIRFYLVSSRPHDPNPGCRDVLPVEMVSVSDIG